MKLLEMNPVLFAVHRNGFCVGTVDYDYECEAWVALDSSYNVCGTAETKELAALMLPLNGFAE